MKADVTSDSRVVSSRSTTVRHGQWLASCAGAGLLVILTTGCHYLRPQHAAEPHYGRLEQACFGYEPTVWRSLPGDCEQAVRMIPDEVVQLPPAAPVRPEPATEPTPDQEEAPLGPADALETESATPDENRVPGVIRGLLEGTTPPPSEPLLPETPPPAAPAEPAMEPPAATPPAVEPATPPSVKPAVPPAVEPATPPSVEPTAPPPTTPTAEPGSDLRQSRKRQVRPVSASAVDHGAGPATDGVAQDLFRTVEHALAVTPAKNATTRQPQHAKANVVVEPERKTPSDAPGTIGLAKFIY